MGFTSLDALTAAMSNGQKERAYFQKATSNAAASAAGRWHELFTATGIPAGGSWSGTTGAATALTRSTVGALPLGANVMPDTRHLTKLAGCTTTSTVPPATAILCDFLLYYPGCVVTGAATTLTNVVTLPRYSDGAGVMAFVAVQTALGATTPALTLTYTDQAGNAGNVASALTSPVASAPVSTLFAFNGLPFLPLAAGDSGVRKIDSYTLATGTTGTVAFVLAKPLAEIPIVALSTMTVANMVHELPSLERVYDDACLGWIISPGGAMAANSTFFGSAEWAWD